MPAERLERRVGPMCFEQPFGRALGCDILHHRSPFCWANHIASVAAVKPCRSVGHHVSLQLESKADDVIYSSRRPRRSGLPVGLSVIADPYRDGDLLRLATGMSCQEGRILALASGERGSGW